MSDRQIEMVWPCPCGTKNLGRYMKCQTCGRPKDDGVEYEMPANVETAESVTDEKLLRMATAGENWHCAYCGSDQRAGDGSCGRCGAGRAEKANQARAAAPEMRMKEAAPTPRGRMALVALVIGFVLFLGTCALLVKTRYARPAPEPVAVAAPPPSTSRRLSVTAVHWKRTISSDRWELTDREGFEPPADAVDKKNVGDRIHHQDQVLDHMETLYDNVEVPDGTRTESYTEHVACGQNCTTTPRTCRQNCKSNKNGFATCTDVCTGGDQHCTTKYCDESRTRQVSKTRTERRPRQEPRYRSEPRYAPWYTYKVMDWVQIATFPGEGDDLAPTWPDASAPVPDAGKHATLPAHASVDGAAKESPAADHETSRERRDEAFNVSLRDETGAIYSYEPRTSEELATFEKGSHHEMRVEAGRAFPRP